MTTTKQDFVTAILAEQERRQKQRTIKRKAAEQLYRSYRSEIFSRTVAQRKGL